jgi:hypothetical protein
MTSGDRLLLLHAAQPLQVATSANTTRRGGGAIALTVPRKRVLGGRTLRARLKAVASWLFDLPQSSRAVDVSQPRSFFPGPGGWRLKL